MWWPLLFPFLMGGAVWFGYKESLARLRRWQGVAESCGLSLVGMSSPWALKARLKARAGPLEARIEATREGIRVAVAVQGPPGFSGVRLRRELYRPSRAREIEVGDEAFDSTFFLEGPMRLVCTLLDAEARHLLISVNDGSRLEISGSEIRAVMIEFQLPLMLPLLVDLGRRFAECGDVAQRMAQSARQDPAAGVRLQNLLLLVREFPGEPATVEALRTACSDPSPQIRLRAAKELGAEGRGVLLELAESAADDVWSAQAVSSLDRELPFERTTAILAHSLRRRRLQTARACLESLGRSGAAEAVDTLVKVMALEKGELATAAALALGATGDADAEPPLIAALQRDTPGLQVAAANALGRVGSTASVLPLKEAAEGDSRDPDLRRATRQAIAEIQSRAQGASPGQLSLAGAEAGQLSLAQAEAGQLSLGDAAGQLSLPPGGSG